MQPRQALLLLLLFLFSCSGDPSVKPTSIGRLSELVVVTDSAFWNSESGNRLHDLLTSAYPGLPQEEPSFNISTFAPEGLSGFVTMHKNIVLIQQETTTDDLARLTARRDVWARPQLVLTAVLPFDAESQIDAIGGRIMTAFRNEERKRLEDACARSGNNELTKTVREKFGIGMCLPGEFFKAREETDFLWLRKETENTSMGVLIFEIPFDGTGWSEESFFHRRDSVCRLYVPGPAEGSYMISDTAFPALAYTDSIDGMPITLVRSLWRMKGDFMGGPYLAATSSDSLRMKLLHVEGFVYAPRYEKRDYMKQVEAIVYSLKMEE